MSKSLFVRGIFLLALSAGAAQAQSTTRTLPNADVVTNQRSDSNGVYNDQRNVTTPAGGSLTNDRTVGNGQYTDTRSGTNAKGGSFTNQRTVAKGSYTDDRTVDRANGATYNSQRVASAGKGGTHSWSGTTAAGRSFSGSRTVR